MEEQTSTAKVLKTQTQVRVGLGVVVFLAAASIVLGAIQISRTIKAPFLPKTSGQTLSDLSSEDERKEEMKKIDTDKDGLSDYDETYIYNTSPFIEDSDSDSLPDKTEVLSGEDPNCPKGRVCFAPQVATSTPEAGNISAESQPPLTAISELLEAAKKPGASADIRKQLEAGGLSKTLLDDLSDQELQKLYAETLKEILATSTKK